MNSLGKNILAFLGFVLAQSVMFNHISLFERATPHVFLLFFLMLPITLRYSVLMLIAFFGGFVMDLFSFNFVKGLHAFSIVLMMTVRLPWLSVITNRLAFRGNEDEILVVQPAIWYVNYLLPLIFIHQFSYYLLEAFSFETFGVTFARIILSTLLTFGLCLLGALLLYKTERK